MVMRGRGKWLALLLVLVPLLSGCVYLRLLDLRDRLRAGEPVLVVEGGEALRVHFTTPVLERGDVATLLGAAPVGCGVFPGGTWESYAFQRTRQPAFVLQVHVRSEGDVLRTVEFPHEIRGLLPPELVRAALAAFSRAPVDTLGRRVEARLEASGAWVLPERTAVEAALGVPDEVRVLSGGAQRAVWHYQAVGPRPVAAVMAVDFAPATALPQRFSVALAGWWAYLELGAPVGAR